jgi:alpha-L-fucosidase
MTMNNTWGYKSYDQDWKSTETLIRNLVDIASKGGNYLLNVGPTAEGLIPDASIERLKDIGAWMKVNSESIYGTTASPCNRPAWGRITTKKHGESTTLYLQVFEWPADGKLFVPFDNKVTGCRLLADADRVFETKTDADGTTVQLTGQAPDPICSVVVLDVEGAPSITAASSIQQKKDGTVLLPANQATINNQGYSEHAKYEKDKDCIGYWVSSKVTVEWNFTVSKPGTFRVSALAASEKISTLTLSLAGQSKGADVPASGGYTSFKPVDAGTFEIDEPGEYTLKIVPVKKGWNPINLRSVNLVPASK